MRLAALSSCLLASALLCGCAAPGPMTAAEFKERCLSSDSSGDCNPEPYCEAYAKALEKQFASRGDCAAQCGRIDSRQWLSTVTGPCSEVAGDADDWCRQFCNRNYPK